MDYPSVILHFYRQTPVVNSVLWCSAPFHLILPYHLIRREPRICHNHGHRMCLKRMPDLRHCRLVVIHGPARRHHHHLALPLPPPPGRPTPKAPSRPRNTQVTLDPQIPNPNPNNVGAPSIVGVAALLPSSPSPLFFLLSPIRMGGALPLA